MSAEIVVSADACLVFNSRLTTQFFLPVSHLPLSVHLNANENFLR